MNALSVKCEKGVYHGNGKMLCLQHWHAQIQYWKQEWQKNTITMSYIDHNQSAVLYVDNIIALFIMNNKAQKLNR